MPPIAFRTKTPLTSRIVAITLGLTALLIGAIILAATQSGRSSSGAVVGIILGAVLVFTVGLIIGIARFGMLTTDYAVTEQSLARVTRPDTPNAVREEIPWATMREYVLAPHPMTGLPTLEVNTTTPIGKLVIASGKRQEERASFDAFAAAFVDRVGAFNEATPGEAQDIHTGVPFVDRPSARVLAWFMVVLIALLIALAIFGVRNGDGLRVGLRSLWLVAIMGPFIGRVLGRRRVR